MNASGTTNKHPPQRPRRHPPANGNLVMAHARARDVNLLPTAQQSPPLVYVSDPTTCCLFPSACNPAVLPPVCLYANIGLYSIYVSAVVVQKIGLLSYFPTIALIADIPAHRNYSSCSF
eukprot:gene8155-790_t